jgi:type IV pilus assembly protein PilB
MIDLTDLEATRTAPDVWRLIRMVLLLSVKDQADRVSFLRTPDGMRMRYRISGEWYDMVPPPADLAPDIFLTLRRISNLPDSWRWSGISWLRRLVGHHIGLE